MILVLGGTSDSHEYINSIDSDFIVSVATEYGYNLFRKRYGDKVRLIRFTESTLAQFIHENNIKVVADCTHPFAAEITATAVKVCGELNVRYHDCMRKTGLPECIKRYDKLISVNSWEDAVSALSEFQGKQLFFTIGSKNLHYFRKFLGNAVVRVLDDPASVAICKELGVADEKIIAARGPFLVDDNLEVVNRWGIECIITKDSGEKGGLPEKLDAAIRAGISILVINREVS